MKKLLLILIITSILVPKKVEAQKAGEIAAAGILAIGVGIAAVKQMEERAELVATQWILSNNPELTSFSLKTLAFTGKKLKDMSAVSIILYNIQEFEPGDNPKINGRKFGIFE
jgi:hypothetical protein